MTPEEFNKGWEKAIAEQLKAKTVTFNEEFNDYKPFTPGFRGYPQPKINDLTKPDNTMAKPNEAITVDQFNTLMQQMETTINGFVSQGTKEINEVKEGVMQVARSLDGTSVTLINSIEEVRNELRSQPRGGGEKFTIEVITPKDIQHIEVNGQHQSFKTLLKALSLKHNVYNHGPTGTGKTTAVFTAGKVLNLNVYPLTVNRETSQFQFLGHVSKGEYHPGVAYEPYKNGGILLIDEIDNGNSNANTAIKTLSDNEEAFFPCGLTKRHPDFLIVANANTVGTGANIQYVGRNQQDKALLNIFKFINWDIDEAFEYSIAWREYLTWGGKEEQRGQFDKLLREIRMIRNAINDLTINHIISPRNVKFFFRDFANGVEIREIINSILFRELTPQAIEKVFAKLKEKRKPGALPSDEIQRAWGS